MSALPKLDRRMQALEDARAEHAEALATAAARVAALEARLSSKLAERARAAKADLGDLKETVRRSVSADAVKTLVAAVSDKVSRLAQETADTVDAMKREQKRAEKFLREARAMDTAAAAELERRVRELESLERARKSRRRKNSVGTAGTSLSPSSSGGTSSSPSTSGGTSSKSDEAPGANGARAEKETPRPDLEPRVEEALGARPREAMGRHKRRWEDTSWLESSPARIEKTRAACSPCPHGKRKDNCRVCSRCEHGKWKYSCKACKSARAEQPVAPEIKPDPEIK